MSEDIDAETTEDGVAPTPIARPNVYGSDPAHELATHAVKPSVAAPEALGAPVSAGRRVVPTKQYVLDTSVRRRVDRRRWF
jgi:hypothetical protein